MNSKRLTLILSRAVSHVMLEDIRAIVPAAALSIFINTLDETRYATVECLQDEENCALLASAVVVWRQLGQIQHIDYRKGDRLRQIADATQFELFSMMKTHRALLWLA